MQPRRWDCGRSHLLAPRVRVVVPLQLYTLTPKWRFSRGAPTNQAIAHLPSHKNPHPRARNQLPHLFYATHRCLSNSALPLLGCRPHALAASFSPFRPPFSATPLTFSDSLRSGLSLCHNHRPALFVCTLIPFSRVPSPLLLLYPSSPLPFFYRLFVFALEFIQNKPTPPYTYFTD